MNETKEEVRVENVEGVRRFYIGDELQSVIPANTDFGMHYWSHMIPWFKPKNVLMLGYGAGTIASLIRKIWGKDTHITGVDKLEYAQELPDIFVKVDAFDFINQSMNRYDYVVVDIRTNGLMDERLFSEDTIRMLSRLTNVALAINFDGKEIKKMQNFVGYFKLRLAQQTDGNVVATFEKQ